MKITKMALTALLVVGLMAATTVPSHAAAATYTCNVNYAGPSTTPSYQIIIRLTYVSGSPTPTIKTKTFYAPATREKEFLAVALTALANTKKVSAYVDFDGAGTTVSRLYLLP